MTANVSAAPIGYVEHGNNETFVAFVPRAHRHKGDLLVDTHTNFLFIVLEAVGSSQNTAAEIQMP